MLALRIVPPRDEYPIPGADMQQQFEQSVNVAKVRAPAGER